ncbi:MAG: hypothetical protein ACTS3R_12790 [Inquilinaceae bacterium]
MRKKSDGTPGYEIHTIGVTNISADLLTNVQVFLEGIEGIGIPDLPISLEADGKNTTYYLELRPREMARFQVFIVGLDDLPHQKKTLGFCVGDKEFKKGDWRGSIPRESVYINLTAECSGSIAIKQRMAIIVRGENVDFVEAQSRA